MKKENVVICPPCGENVGLPTKRGANKVSPILPLLPRLTAVLPPQGREITTRAFTLIELLVVVLIIGILAAVAVPQYQKAVIKSRYATLKNLVASIAQAQEVYYLANGQYATDFEELDISMPAEDTNHEYEGEEDEVSVAKKKFRYYKWGHCDLNDPRMIKCTNDLIKMQYKQNYQHLETNASKRTCVALTTDITDLPNQVCKMETNTEGNVSYSYGGYTLYWYE